MFIRKLVDCDEFTAGDACSLRELLHPGKMDVKIRYSLAHAAVKPGQTTQPHRLKNPEVYYITQGEGEMNLNGELAEVGAGDCIYIPHHATQCIKNTGDENLLFLCIVDPAWQPEDEEVL